MNKKSKAFMPLEERMAIVEALEMVDEVRVVPYRKDMSAIDFLEDVKASYPDDRIVFTNGGDRTSENIPEMSVEGIEFEFGVGGTDKKNSSSWILRNALALGAEERQWGRFYNFFLDKDIKVKELIVDPGKKLSFQRHQHRNEYWFVSKGECIVRGANGTSHLTRHLSYDIPIGQWHQLINHTDQPVHIIEIQYGTETVEEDIERKEVEDLEWLT